MSAGGDAIDLAIELLSPVLGRITSSVDTSVGVLVHNVPGTGISVRTYDHVTTRTSVRMISYSFVDLNKHYTSTV